MGSGDDVLEPCEDNAGVGSGVDMHGSSSLLNCGSRLGLSRHFSRRLSGSFFCVVSLVACKELLLRLPHPVMVFCDFEELEVFG